MGTIPMTRYLTDREMEQSVKDIAASMRDGEELALRVNGKTVSIRAEAEAEEPSFDYDQWFRDVEALHKLIPNPPSLEEILQDIRDGRK